MVFCTNCGTRIEDGIKFCTNCGQPVKESESKENPENTPGTQGKIVEAEVLNPENNSVDTVEAVEIPVAVETVSDAKVNEKNAAEPTTLNEQPVTEPTPSYSQPGQNQIPTNQPVQEQPRYGQNLQGQQPYVQNPQGQPVYGQNQQGQPPYGQNPQGQPVYGQNQQGQQPYGQNPQRPPYGAPVYGQNQYGQQNYQQQRPPYGQNPQGQPPYGQNPQGQQPYRQPAAPVYPQPGVIPQNGIDVRPMAGSIYEPVGTGAYMGFMFLFLFPVIGWIIALIVACGGSKRVNLRNFAKAYLFWLLIGIIFTVIFVVLAITVLSSIFEDMDIFNWVYELERNFR